MKPGSSQKGIQALFTPRKQKHRTLREAIGLLTIGLGVGIWTWAVLVFTGTIELAIVSDRTSSAIILLSFSVPLLATGSTVFAYSRVSRGTGDEELNVESLTSTTELSSGMKRSGASQPPIFSTESRSKSSTAVVAALVEGVVIILLYGWLVKEYDSSIYMRAWVESNIPLAATVLNDNTFFLLIGIVIASALFQVQARKRRP